MFASISLPSYVMTRVSWQDILYGSGQVDEENYSKRYA